MSAKKKMCALRFPGEGGRCRRVAGRDGLCRRHSVARLAVQSNEYDLREAAIELCGSMELPLVPGRALLEEEAQYMCALHAANERLQSALVALHSRSGRDEDAE